MDFLEHIIRVDVLINFKFFSNVNILLSIRLQSENINMLSYNKTIFTEVPDVKL